MYFRSKLPFVKFTLPRSPIALAVFLFLIDLGLGLVLVFLGRILGIDLSGSFVGSVRSYAAAAILAMWYVHSHSRALSKHDAKVTSFTYAAVSFVILSAVFMLRGTSTLTSVFVTIGGTLIILAVQYVLIAYLIRKVSEVVHEGKSGSQKLPGI